MNPNESSGGVVHFDKQELAAVYELQSLVRPSFAVGQLGGERSEHCKFLRWYRVCLAKVAQCQMKVSHTLQAAWRPLHRKCSGAIVQVCRPANSKGALSGFLHQLRVLIHKP